MRLTLETRSKTGLIRAAAGSQRAFTASPIPSGSSMRSRSERAIFAASTDTPSSSSGSTSGM